LTGTIHLFKIGKLGEQRTKRKEGYYIGMDLLERPFKRKKNIHGTGRITGTGREKVLFVHVVQALQRTAEKGQKTNQTGEGGKNRLKRI